jgi:hypothetical protein
MLSISTLALHLMTTPMRVHYAGTSYMRTWVRISYHGTVRQTMIPKVSDNCRRLDEAGRSTDESNLPAEVCRFNVIV